MRASFFKKMLCGALALALILIGCNFKASSFVYAETSVDYINYVSLGDSIATGYGLDGYGSDLDFVAGSYETLFKTFLQTNATDVNAESYAVDGHTAANLLNLLKTNTAVKTSVESADIITVSIGGNDLLGPARANIISCFVQGSYDNLKTALNSAVSNFETAFANILTELNSINPNAKVLFTNIYNPYKSLMTATNNITLNLTDVPSFGNTSVVINATQINEFGALTEAYIAGDSSNNITGVNQIIQQQLEGYDNYHFIDSKSAFDGYVGDYTEIACASLTTYEEITMTFEDLYSNNKIFDYLDPHPTARGHQILAREFQSGFAEELAIIKIDYNGGTLANLADEKYITTKNKTITQPEQPILEHHTFEGWSTNKNSFEIYDFSSNVVSNLTLYASWQAITYTVKFDYNGGKVGDDEYSEIIVTEGMTIVKPTGEEIPSLEKFKFVGWYTDNTLLEEFDFATPIEEDTTLYAKWEQIAFDVTFDYNGGEIDGQTSKTLVIDKNSLIIEPTGEEIPTLLDYRLVGWYTDPSFQNVWDFANDTVTSDVTLYAQWECTVWYVTFNFNGGNVNGVTNQVIKVAKGNKLDEPAFKPDRNGYVFMYWYLTDETIEFDFQNTDITSDITIYAFWKNGIVVKWHYGDYIDDTIKMPVGSTVGDMAIPKRDGTMFYGWFTDNTYTVEYESSKPLTDGTIYYIKWITLVCENESLLIQEYSPISKNVNWHIDARNGSLVSWQVNGQAVEYGTGTVIGTMGASWSFIPAEYGVGNYVITCIVDGGVVNGKTIQINYSVPVDVLINLDSVVNKKTYIVQVDNQQYYDSSKFVWYKTSDPYSDDFAQEIGTGFELIYTFDNDCKICVMYQKDGTDDIIMSNVIDVSVDNHVDAVTLIVIIVTLLVIAVIIVGAVVSYRRNKGTY